MNAVIGPRPHLSRFAGTADTLIWLELTTTDCCVKEGARQSDEGGEHAEHRVPL